MIVTPISPRHSAPTALQHHLGACLDEFELDIRAAAGKSLLASAFFTWRRAVLTKIESNLMRVSIRVWKTCPGGRLQPWVTEPRIKGPGSPDRRNSRRFQLASFPSPIWHRKIFFRLRSMEYSPYGLWEVRNAGTGTAACAVDLFQVQIFCFVASHFQGRTVKCRLGPSCDGSRMKVADQTGWFRTPGPFASVCLLSLFCGCRQQQ